LDVIGGMAGESVGAGGLGSGDAAGNGGTSSTASGGNIGVTAGQAGNSTSTESPPSALGYLDVQGVGTCIATLIAANKVLVAATCLGDSLPDAVTFFPHAATSSSRALRIVRGRDPGSDNPTGDWAIVTLDRSFVAHGTLQLSPGEPSSPEALRFATYSETGLQVSSSCALSGDAEQELVSCEEPEFSTGPAVAYETTSSGRDRVIGLVPARAPSLPEPNRVFIPSRYFAFAPDNPVDITIAYISRGGVQVYAIDRDWLRMVTCWRLTEDPDAAFSPWQLLESPIAEPRKLKGVNRFDGEQALYALDDNGDIWSTTVNTDDGGVTATDWQRDTTPAPFLDLALVGGAGLPAEMYGLGADGRLYLRHTLEEPARSTWSRWSELGAVMDDGFRAIAAVRAGVHHHLFVVTLEGSVWSTHSQDDQLEDWGPFVDLGGLDVRAISAGTLADGRVHLQAITEAGSLYHSIGAPEGGAWTPWARLHLDQPSLSGAIFAVATRQLQDGREHLLAIFQTGELFETWQGWKSPGQFVPWSRF
jgi:hypothetical protein